MSIIIFIILIAIFVALSCVKVVNQSKIGMIMRLGKFHKTAETGVNFLVPFLDTMTHIIDLREQVVDFRPQPVITKDNITMRVNSIVYYRITDPVRYTFEIASPISAIENLTATTLRNLMGELDLDETLTSRELINTKMRSVLDEATDRWGIKISRVELKDIIPPEDIQVAMEKQMRAERERRESILQAEGEKESGILRAQGVKEATILEAEAKKEAMIRESEGIRESKVLEAEGEAQAIIKIQDANVQSLKNILFAMKTANIDENMLAFRSIEALEKLGDGQATKLVLPSDTVKFLGTFKGINEVMKDDSPLK
ncbi:MAG: SPFH domain-containing protein [Peptostreptococcaceae bacterium]